MLKPNYPIFFGVWVMLLIVVIAGLAYYNASMSSGIIPLIALIILPSYSISIILFLRKNFNLGKSIYLFIISESFFIFFGLVVSDMETSMFPLFFTLIPIPFFIIWYFIKNKSIIETKIDDDLIDEEQSKKTVLDIHPKNLDEYMEKNISDLLKLPESEYLEFKSTLKWDIRLNKGNSSLTVVCIKTIAGFLNNKGGILIIGYDDDNNVLYGLEKDYPVTSNTRQNFDGWQQYLINQINEILGKTTHHYFSIESIPYDGKTLAKINVSKSPKPVFAKLNQQGGDFFVRIHGQTENMNPEDTNKWIFEHFSA